MPTEIKIEGLEELQGKLSKFTPEMHKAMNITMERSLVALQDAIPPYPPKPVTSKYRRTGTLGKSIGRDGKAVGTGIYEITGAGGNIQGRFGTNLVYAKYVIDPEQQAYMHKGRWWTMAKLAKDARGEVIKVFEQMVQVASKWLAGR